MSTNLMLHEPPSALRLITQAYMSPLIIGFALLPTQLIAYLNFQQDPALKFEDHLFHEFAIAIATLEGLFVTYATWRCYQSSGEPLLRWLTLGFLAFVLIYTLQGAFTGMAQRNIWLFCSMGQRRAWRCRFCSSSGYSATTCRQTGLRSARTRAHG
ncbi:hypothetical protein [Bradyrhizobium sp. CCBAU 45321]|uniref:hypothetical protein n=1 Tax=Bradyrhizobium sp. CCBAU 45321 TaxID=1641878 RepID=UPI0023021DD8|nr:hypothetical protein [Bradyrhizobium sp. CCBAU 45321]